MRKAANQQSKPVTMLLEEQTPTFPGAMLFIGEAFCVCDTERVVHADANANTSDERNLVLPAKVWEGA